MPGVMPDLVLQARLNMLRSSLIKVRTVLADLEHARDRVSGGSDQLAVARTLVDAVARVVDDLGVAIGGLTPTLRETLTKQVLHPLQNAQNAAGAELEPTGVRRYLPLTGTSVEQNLGEEVAERLAELDDLAVLVARARAAESPERDELLVQAWKAYEECDRECDKLFLEYVDLVRGVLLRDAELDDQLFRIADELVRLWGRFKDYTWESFTIPASRDRRGMSAARLIRIGFPEWSIWVLPVTAHEFGHVFASRHDRMQPVIDDVMAETGLEKEAVHSWVADAFATAVMGPAFVWATMLLRTDPGSPDERVRVGVMLAMLARLTERSPEYGEVATRVRDTWACVLGHAAPEASADADEWRGPISKVVNAVWQRVAEPFGPNDWKRALKLVDRLAEAPVAEIVADLQVRELRHVLVAAWEARIRLAGRAPEQGDDAAEFAGDQWDRLSELAVRTRQVCIELIEGAPDRRTTKTSAVAVDTQRPTSAGDAEDKGRGGKRSEGVGPP